MWSAKREMKAWTRQLRQKYSDLPDRYRGYEALLEGDRDEVTANTTPKGNVNTHTHTSRKPYLATKYMYMSSSFNCYTEVRVNSAQPLPLGEVINSWPVISSTDLHACTHALRYALKHPLTISNKHSTKPRGDAGNQRQVRQVLSTCTLS